MGAATLRAADVARSGVKTMRRCASSIKFCRGSTGFRGNKDTQLNQRLIDGLGKTWSQDRTFA